MEDKNSMGFWIFLTDDPEFHRFYAARAGNAPLYCILCIRECSGNSSPEARELFHVRNSAILMLDPWSAYLLPVYQHMRLKGYAIILTEAFCSSDRAKALLQYYFFRNLPDAVTELGAYSDDLKTCIDLMYEEYSNPYDDLQPSMLRNLMVNLMLLSSRKHSTLRIRDGHLLDCALRFMELVNRHGFREKKKSFYAGRLGTTASMLDQALHETYRKTFREILVYRTLTEAMRLLVFGDKSVTQTAQALNCDVSDFNKLFMKWKGMSPYSLRADYREIIQHIEHAC
jgi:AraC-like DNA-binding protein